MNGIIEWSYILDSVKKGFELTAAVTGVIGTIISILYGTLKKSVKDGLKAALLAAIFLVVIASACALVFYYADYGVIPNVIGMEAQVAVDRIAIEGFTKPRIVERENVNGTATWTVYAIEVNGLKYNDRKVYIKKEASIVLGVKPDASDITKRTTEPRISPIAAKTTTGITPQDTPNTYLRSPELRGWNGENYQYVVFGRLPSSGSSIKEPILWRILYTNGNYALLLSEYIIDARIFDKATSEWGKSNIKKWLTREFFNNAFSSEEAGAIVEERELGKVFLLSKADYLNPDYGFLSDSDTYDTQKKAKGIANALNNGLWLSEDKHSTYFTRTSDGSKHVWQVRQNGSIGLAKIDRDNVGIRPGILIDLSRWKFTEGTGTMASPLQ